MSRCISVNLDEGPIEAFDGLKCDSLLQKITVCRNCGRIHFLSAEQTGFCRNHKLHTLEKVLQAKKKRMIGDIRTQYVFTMISTLLCLVVLSILFLMKKNNSPETNMELFCSRIAPCGIILTILCLIYQIIGFYRIMKYEVSEEGFTALLIREFTPDKPEYQGQSWEQAILAAYACQVGDLEKWARTLNASKETTPDAWATLYSNAMELSYMNDNEQLALLRLVCLDRMTLLPNTYTDIRQIIRILPESVLFNWLETVTNCLERLCIPCDRPAAEHFVALADYCISKAGGTDRQDIIQKVKRGFLAIGPYYVLPEAGKYPGLSGVISDLTRHELLYQAAFLYMGREV